MTSRSLEAMNSVCTPELFCLCGISCFSSHVTWHTFCQVSGRPRERITDSHLFGLCCWCHWIFHHPCLSSWPQKLQLLWGSPMLVAQKLSLQCGRPRFAPWVGKILWRRKLQPTPVLLPGKSHRQRSVVGYSPWCCKESATTERLHFTSLMLTWGLGVSLVFWLDSATMRPWRSLVPEKGLHIGIPKALPALLLCLQYVYSMLQFTVWTQLCLTAALLLNEA